jgi:pimeloyl-ACP methyl ester carboxylesterase
MTYASVNGLQMYYEIHGQPGGDRTPLLLLHGGGSTIETSFARLLPLLSKGRPVIAFEQQGHGRTADVDRPFSFDQSAADAVALLRYLEVPKVDLFGYSNGGHIALQIALDHRETVRKLILESMMYSREGAAPQFWEGIDHAKLQDMPQELREAYQKTAPHPEHLQTFFDKSVQRMRGFEGWTQAQIRSVKAPTLLLLGDRDVVTVAHAAQMQQLLPDGQLAVLPAADHSEIILRSRQVAELVDEFLGPPH